MAKVQGQQGRVVCRASSDKAGRICDVGLVESSGFELLDAAALDALKRAYLDRPLESERFVAFQFEMH
jgi:TonB family protein